MLMNQAADEKQMLMNQAVQDADEIGILMDQATQAADEMLRFSDIFSDLSTHIPKDVNIKTRRRKKQGREESPMGGAKKRKLSTEQMNFLEMSFGIEHKLQSSRKIHLAGELGLDPEQVAVWFQNRRTRWKSKQLEEEYAKMKAAHEAVIVQKCQLEAEVLKLREQLLEAEKKVRMLSKHPVAGVSASSSPSSSLSIDPAFLGEFEENFLYAPESMDWENLYYL